MKKSILLSSCIFLLLNSAVSAGRYVILSVEDSPSSPKTLGKLKYYTHPERTIPLRMAQHFNQENNKKFYIFDIDKCKAEVSTSGKTGVIKVNDAYDLIPYFDHKDRFSDHQENHYTLFLKYNIESEFSYGHSVYYLAENVSKPVWRTALNITEHGDAVEKELQWLRQYNEAKKAVLTILSDDLQNPSPKFTKGLEKKCRKEEILSSEEAYEFAKRKLEAERKRNREEQTL